MMSSNHGKAEAMARFRLHVNVVAFSAVLVLLLTAFAQAV